MTERPLVVEMTVHNTTDGTSYVKKFVEIERLNELIKKFDQAISQRNLLARKPDLIDGLDPEEIIQHLDEELGIKKRSEPRP